MQGEHEEENGIRHLYRVVLAGFMILFFMTSLVFSRKFAACMAGGYLVFCAGAIILQKMEEKNGRRGVPAAVLLAAVFASRLLYSVYAAEKVEQISDFGIALEGVRSGEFAQRAVYYMMAPYKMVYPYFLHFLGFSGEQLPIFIVQSALAAVTALGIYLTAREVVGERYGIIAVFLYLIWPGQLFYTSVFTEEHLASAVTIFILFLCIHLFDWTRRGKSFSRFAVGLTVISTVAGVLCGIDIMLKDWAVIVIIAIICMLPLYLGERKRVLALLFSMVLIVGIREGIHQELLSFVSEKIGGITPDNGIFLHMYTSLDPSGTLSHNEELTEEYIELYTSTGCDPGAAHKRTMEVVRERIQENTLGFARLLLLKISRSYISGNREILEWSCQEYTQEEGSKFKTFVLAAGALDDILYAGMAVMIIIAVIFDGRREVIFMALVIAGAMSSQQLIEAQGRYKYSIEPLWCVTASVGLRCIEMWFRRMSGYQRQAGGKVG